MIVIAGGTGRLGTLLVEHLNARGQPVRVITRDPTRTGRAATGLVEVVVGDVRDRATLARAVDGATVVVSAITGFPGTRDENPTTIDCDGNINLADAAHAAGADLLMMSVVGASADHPMELFRMKHAAEEHARGLGLPLTVIRATAYLELWVGILQQTAGRSGRPIVFGSGNNPINFVSVHEVASVVNHAVIDPSVRGRTLLATGPHNVTFNDLATAVQTAAGRTSAPRHFPRTALGLVANTLGRAQPALGRQLRAAVTMDTVDLTAGPSDLPETYERPSITLAMCLADATTPQDAR
jgi:uncharacterized protein YbjT (DUF2867 family)